MKCPKCQTDNPDGAKFCNECAYNMRNITDIPAERFSHPQSYTPKFLADKILAHKNAVEGERKHVTVLFSDLSGYTAMCERLDPEEVKEIMSRIFGDITQVVTKYEGFIEKFIGDAVMALFGVPKSHEDDPVRAIRAAREIQELIDAMSPKLKDRIGKPLSMHTGISSGLVVTGEVDLDEGTHGVAGDTINLTARLCSHAKGGEILVGANTYHQALGFFAFEELKPVKVKGKTEPVRIYKVLSPEDEPRKIHRICGLRAELVGRKLEMAQLEEAVERLNNGEGSVFSISGDLGTGKSRLIEEFKASLDLEKIQWREGHAYAYSQNIPYFPLIDLLNRAWQIKEGDPPETVKKKVESSISYLIGKKEDAVPYIGSLYTLDYPEIEGVDPEFWKIRLHQAILEILSALAQRAPSIICLEDLHWADHSSLDLLRFILSEFKHPALFLFVYRSHFTLFASHQLNTMDKSYHDIRLKDLSPSEALDMTASILKTNTIPSDLQRLLHEKVEGNPFYLEEVINLLIESDTLVRDNGTWKLTRSVSESGISPTIHGVISGRLDRLDKESKRILQEASIIGRAFLYEILKRITDLKDNIDPCLNLLEGLDLIRTRFVQPELEYIFKHALIQEVAYEGLLKKERRTIHERIGLMMEELFQDRLSDFYEILAFHFKQGRSILKAVDYLVRSGEKSLRKYAVDEVHQYFEEAFELLTTKHDRSKEEEDLLIDLINKWAVAFTYRADYRALGNLLRVHTNIAESLDDKTKLGMFYGWLGVVAHCRERYRDAYQYLYSALKLGEETEDQKVIGFACGWLSLVCGELGLLEEGVSFGERALEIFGLFSSDQIFHYQHHPFSQVGYIYFQKGNKKKVLEKAKALLDSGQKNSNMPSLVCGHWLMGLCCFLDGDFHSAIEYHEKAIQLSQNPIFSHVSKISLGIFYNYHGQFHEAEGVLRELVAFSEKFGSENVGTMAKLYLGASLIGQGRMAEGLRMIEKAQRLFIENERKGVYAMSEHILGKVYLQIVERATPMTFSIIAKNIGFLIGNVPFASKKAEYHFKKAIEVSKEIGAKSTLSLAYLDLGLLHKAKGRMNHARECISKSIDLFEQIEAEGFMKQAKKALASLG